MLVKKDLDKYHHQDLFRKHVNGFVLPEESLFPGLLCESQKGLVGQCH